MCQLIREIQPQGPYAVIGWCAAGVLAFETAQQLVQMGHEVSFVGIIDGWAPDYVRRRGDAWLKATNFATRCKRAYAETRAGRRNVKSLVLKSFTLMMKAFTCLRRAQRGDANPVWSDQELEMIEQFHWEMWKYLWRLQGAYEPKPFHGRVHIFVSQYRPTGWPTPAWVGGGSRRKARRWSRSRGITGNFSMSLLLAKPRQQSLRAWKLGRTPPPRRRRPVRQAFAGKANPRRLVRS